MKHTFYTSKDLIERLCHEANEKDKSVTFLVGSALALPDHPGGHGVPGVTGIIDLIRDEFKGEEEQLDRQLTDAASMQYQQAFQFLHARRGQDVANRIVRTAVWKSLDLTRWPRGLPQTTPQDAKSAICKALEDDSRAWTLPKSVDDFGRLLVTCFDTFGKTVLTTNFDPLIAISIAQNGGRHYRTVLDQDGHLGHIFSEGTHLIHLHGYWQGSDTLHTPTQLTHPRPHLTRSLARVLEKSVLVAIGYSGWDDVITRTLVDLLSDSQSTHDIMWAFHGRNIRDIEDSNHALLSILSPGIGRGRVSLFHNVDCRTIFEEIYSELKEHYPRTLGTTHSSPITTVVTEERAPSTSIRQLRIEIGVPIPQQRTAESDRPLIVDPWVGRSQELDIIAKVDVPVAFISGLGGQGKSALAGQVLKQEATSQSGRFELWDWRDCREESDRLLTQILRLIERLSNGAIDASTIEANNIHAVVAILFNVLSKRKALLVFDNVDQYIDLETLAPVKDLEVLIGEAQARLHQSLFLFTCRPDVQVDESRAMRITLDGLGECEVKELIRARGVPMKDLRYASDLHRTTQGHPLWINLITMQALRHPEGMQGALSLIGQGGATLPDTTRTIWRMLNDQQRDVLRTMAELDRPEPENRLMDVLPGLNINRVNRALRTLRSFHMIEVRTQTQGEPLLGLHPIIREFVRTNFPIRDREKYVGAILDFLDSMIHRYKALLARDPSYDIMEHWMRKADLHIRFGRHEEATSTISEVAQPLINRGYSEAMIRYSRRLFDSIDWAEACSSFREFDTVFEKCVTSMIQLGHEACGEVLVKYENAIPGRSSQYILLCDLRCYLYWYKEDFETAVLWGQKGDQLKQSTPVDTRFSTKHNLALSLRDAGRVNEALESFLGDEPLKEVIAPDNCVPSKGAPFYGNVGRCLFLSGQMDEALVCYVKSAQLLESSRLHSSRLNKGYVRLWIGELLERRREFGMAMTAYRGAVCMWEDSSPPRCSWPEKRMQEIVASNPELEWYIELEELIANEAFSNWLESQ